MGFPTTERDELKVKENLNKMSRKRNHPTTPNLITPAIFLSSIEKLNILPESAQLNHNRHNRKNPEDEEQEEQDKGDTKSNKKEQLVCFSNEAIEILRQCHGRFISLLASELAFGEHHSNNMIKKEQNSICNDSNNHGVLHMKRKGRKRKITNVGNANSNNNVVNEEDSGQAKVKNILPQSVADALENLEFNKISSQIQSMVKNRNIKKNKIDNEKVHNSSSSDWRSSSTTTKHEDNLISDEITAKNPNCNSYATKLKGTKCSKTKKKNMKKAFKNDAMTAEMLQEQERLFAQSVAKAKLM